MTDEVKKDDNVDTNVKQPSEQAKADADALLAKGEEDRMVTMRSLRGDHTSVTIGKREYKVDPKKQTVRVAIRHVHDLRAHGFEVVAIGSD